MAEQMGRRVYRPATGQEQEALCLVVSQFVQIRLPVSSPAARAEDAPRYHAGSQSDP